MAADEGARPTLALLARAMQLEGGAPPGERLVWVHSGPLPSGLAQDGALHISLAQAAGGLSPDWQAIHLTRVFIQAVEDCGGLLLHGALAQRGAAGPAVLLAGASGVGKSTASRRLPPPWRSLSDDAALLVRGLDELGRPLFFAHPWPTWSAFRDGGPGGSWQVEQAVPLSAVFFLEQTPHDRVVPLNLAQAAAHLVTSNQQIKRLSPGWVSLEGLQQHNRQQAASALALARSLPAFTLQISLQGSFWELMAEAIERQPGQPLTPLFTGCDLRAAYHGPSMNPTLREPDLLSVQSGQAQTAQAGDVLYYRAPGAWFGIVHRVVEVVQAPGLPPRYRTQGDNNSQADPQLVHQGEVIGVVTHAERGGRLRRVHGGRAGLWLGRWRRLTSRLALAARQAAARLGLGRPASALRRAGIQRLALAGLRQVVFTTPQRSFVKLLWRGRLVGQYDAVRRRWLFEPGWGWLFAGLTIPAPQAAQPPEHSASRPERA